MQLHSCGSRVIKIANSRQSLIQSSPDAPQNPPCTWANTLSTRKRWSSASGVKRDSSCDASPMATMMTGCDTTTDDSTDVVGSKEDVLRAAVIVTPPQPSTVKWW
ncbi:hypothetical protein TNCV_3397681 [Trichonephila clavipes]|nr:hypothetical protein TNCV_3397681 [Trichonephila clavipes]